MTHLQHLGESSRSRGQGTILAMGPDSAFTSQNHKNRQTGGEPPGSEGWAETVKTWPLLPSCVKWNSFFLTVPFPYLK